MDLLKSEGQKDKLTLHLDPFKKDCIRAVDIHFSAIWSSGPYWWASVDFKNGNTSGSQRFGDYKPDEYDKMIKEIQAFLDSL